MDLETYASRHLEVLAAPLKSSTQIGEAFSASGMSEDELSDFLEAEKYAMRSERRAKRERPHHAV